jgi:hypothetical protein
MSGTLIRGRCPGAVDRRRTVTKAKKQVPVAGSDDGNVQLSTKSCLGRNGTT